MQKLMGIERISFQVVHRHRRDSFLSHFLPGSGTMPEEGMAESQKAGLWKDCNKTASSGQTGLWHSQAPLLAEKPSYVVHGFSRRLVFL